MILLHYRIALPNHHDPADLRRRVAETAPLFDGYPDLVNKAFLLAGHDQDRKAYGAVYLWRNAQAARRYLLGPDFAALTRTFGRPPVDLWPLVAAATAGGGRPDLAVHESLPLTPGQDLDQAAAEGQASANEADLHSRWVALNGARWRLERFTLWRGVRPAVAAAGATAESYQVLHLSTPPAAGDRFEAVARQWRERRPAKANGRAPIQA
jgi:hypothetical protein